MRRIEGTAGDTWEISHDFVARQLTAVLPTWRASVWRRSQPLLAPVAIGLWLIIVVLIPPYYHAIRVQEAVLRLQADAFRVSKTGESYDVVPDNSLDYRYEEVIARRHKSGMDFWDAVLTLGRIRTLDLDTDEKHVSIIRIGQLKELINLNLNNLDISDLTPLISVKTLRTLSIANTQVASFAPLRNLPLKGLLAIHVPARDFQNLPGSLEELSVVHNDIGDFNFLRRLKSITSLHLSSTDIETLDPVSEMSRLSKITVDNCQRLRDISALNKTPLLRLLSMRGANRDVDVLVLKDHPSLRQFFFEEPPRHTAELLQYRKRIGKPLWISPLFKDPEERKVEGN